jgi:hypothetical protein
VISTALLSFILFQQAAVPTAQLGADWSSVVALRVGTAVRITEANGNRSTGKLTKRDANGIELSDDLVLRNISRSEIRRVEKRQQQHAIKHGFWAGATVGFLMTTLAVKNDQLIAYPVFTLGWGGVGAAGGLISGALSRSYETVFERH